MVFTTPLWLMALAPWAGVALWLLWGRRTRIHVPFISLWRHLPQPNTRRKAFQPPPLPLAAAIVAMLLAILAAARPELVRAVHRQGSPISIIIDHGITMSGNDGSVRRLDTLIDQCAPVIDQIMGDGPVELLSVPGSEVQSLDRGSWAAKAKQLPPTAVDSRPGLKSAIAARLAGANTPVLVLTDQPVDADLARVTIISPANRLSNVGIIQLAARPNPRPQIMVRIANQSALSQTVLRIICDAQEVAKQTVNLPAAGSQQDYFIDLPMLSQVVCAKIEPGDDQPADDQAWLLRQQLWPIIEPRSSLPAELQRLIDRYQQLRPGTAQSKQVAVVTSMDTLPPNQPAVAWVGAGGKPVGGSVSNFSVAAHPITQSINQWPGRNVTISGSRLDPSWMALVSANGQTLAAVRSTPTRQVWVGFSAEQWPMTPQFVIFWTNIFTWLGEGGDQYASQPASPLGPEWKLRADSPAPPIAPSEPGIWPGIYQRTDGVLLAVNAAYVPASIPPARPWQEQLAALATQHRSPRAGQPLAAGLIIVGMSLLVLSALTWRTSRPITSEPA